MWGQTASVVAQWVLIHAHAAVRAKITHEEVNVYLFVPSAFTTLRNKVKRVQKNMGVHVPVREARQAKLPVIVAH